jgi:hypothetical protein
VVVIPPAFPLYAYSLAFIDELHARIDGRGQFSGKEHFLCLQHTLNVVSNSILYIVFPEVCDNSVSCTGLS